MCFRYLQSIYFIVLVANYSVVASGPNRGRAKFREFPKDADRVGLLAEADRSAEAVEQEWDTTVRALTGDELQPLEMVKHLMRLNLSQVRMYCDPRARSGKLQMKCANATPDQIRDLCRVFESQVERFEKTAECEDYADCDPEIILDLPRLYEYIEEPLQLKTLEETSERRVGSWISRGNPCEQYYAAKPFFDYLAGVIVNVDNMFSSGKCPTIEEMRRCAGRTT
jgi:hypothetical protein